MSSPALQAGASEAVSPPPDASEALPSLQADATGATEADAAPPAPPRDTGDGPAHNLRRRTHDSGPPDEGSNPTPRPAAKRSPKRKPRSPPPTRRNKKARSSAMQAETPNQPNQLAVDAPAADPAQLQRIEARLDQLCKNEETKEAWHEFASEFQAREEKIRYEEKLRSCEENIRSRDEKIRLYEEKLRSRDEKILSYEEKIRSCEEKLRLCETELQKHKNEVDVLKKTNQWLEKFLATLQSTGQPRPV